MVLILRKKNCFDRGGHFPPHTPISFQPLCCMDGKARREAPFILSQSQGDLRMNDAIQTALKRLRLSGLADSLEIRLQEAAGNRLSHQDFLELILQDELLVRHGSADPAAGQDRGLSGTENAGGFRLAVQSLRQTKTDLRSGQLPVSCANGAMCCSWGRRAPARVIWPRRWAIRPLKTGFVVKYRSVFRCGPRLPAG